MNKTMLKVNLPVSILREDKRFVAYSPALDLSTSGESYKEVKERFKEIVEIFFEEIIKRNTLDEVLQGLGWRKIETRWSPPVVVSQESQTIQVPARV